MSRKTKRITQDHRPIAQDSAIAVLPPPTPTENATLAICRACGSSKLIAIERRPRLIVAGPMTVSYQNHRCMDCGTTTVVRREL